MNQLPQIRPFPITQADQNSLIFTKTRVFDQTVFCFTETSGPNPLSSQSESPKSHSTNKQKTRTSHFCKKKENWYHDEDQQLLALIAKHGPKNWSKIASHFPNRQGKQCRERWHNHLNPHINKTKWTIQEERTLLRAYLKYNSRWAIIARFLPGRTDNCIKNHYNSTIKRKLRMKELSTDMTPLVSDHRHTSSGTYDSDPETAHEQSFEEHLTPFQSPQLTQNSSQVVNITPTNDSQQVRMTLPVFDYRDEREPAFLNNFLAKIYPSENTGLNRQLISYAELLKCLTQKTQYLF